ncbi:MAG: segregation/condensation protein A [Acidimicrobiia bacterium]|nr:segregation/condensation protein A [Acidimicrobiia bacterium]
MPYEVQTSVFEGPFDLLLHLILREQVDLYEISLARIVDAYLVEIDKMESVDLEITTEFLLIAATLVELKCKRLLPDDTDFDLDDEFSLWEERDLLIARLLDCKTFKDAAHVLSDLFDNAALCVPRRAGLDERYLELAPDLLEGVDIDDVRAAYIRAMTPKIVPTVSIEHIRSVRVSVGEAVEELIDELPRFGRVSFRRLTESLVERLEIVVRFLAVLELFKQGFIELDQPAAFGDIEIIWVGSPALDVADLAGIDTYDG